MYQSPSFFLRRIAVTDLRDLKTILLEIRPTGKHFWINVGDNDHFVKGQNVRQLAYNKCLVFKMLSIFVCFIISFFCFF